MLYLFKSTHKVIKAEKLFKENNIYYKIVPVPKSISSECGMAIEIESKNEINCTHILRENTIEFEKH